MITLVDIKPDAIGAVDEVITSGDNFIPPRSHRAQAWGRLVER